MSDPNYPPGVTEGDISQPEGKTCPNCKGKGKIDYSTCCDANLVHSAELEVFLEDTKQHSVEPSEEADACFTVLSSILKKQEPSVYCGNCGEDVSDDLECDLCEGKGVVYGDD